MTGPPTEYEQLSPGAAARIDAACDAFEAEWRQAKSALPAPRIALHLDGFAEPERSVLLNELVALDRACRKRYGVAPRPEEYEALGHLADTPGPSSPSPSAAATATSASPVLSADNWPSIPGLELLELVGSGGMGVVFKARQATLERDVAVKLLRDSSFGASGLRERFAQEARAVARLQHPHLVRVYEFGEAPSAGGAASQPYLVLEFVPGGSLADMLRGMPQPPRETAQLVATVAEAVQYAHRQGVIHRDLKPANILLERTAGESAEPPASAEANGASRSSPLNHHQPKITDFGLAKFQTGSDLTRTGDVLGTPSYMAPEQTTGKSAIMTAAVDVYGLGAILYEMLTGRPPFMADTAVATVVLVQHEEPVAPRRLQPTVPRDLETICLKCLRKEPRHRYATAQDLADDLKRFLAGEPIWARPVGAGERAVRWCRRKPLVAGLLSALVLALVAGLGGVLWQWRSAQRHAIAADLNALHYKRERDVARQEHERGERHLRRVRQEAERLTQVGRDLWLDPRLYKTGRAVLQQALALYEELLPEEGNDPQVRSETARLYRQVGEMRHSLGQWNDAVAAYERQRDLLVGLLAENPANATYRRQLAQSHRFRGFVLHDMSKFAQARDAYNEAIALYETMLSERPGDLDAQVELANTLLNIAVQLSPRDNREELERLYTRMLELSRGAVKAAPARADFQGELALDLEGQGTFFLNTGRAAEALPMLREVLAVREKEFERRRSERFYISYVARAHTNLARALHLARQEDQSRQEYQAAIKLLESAVAQYPETPRYQSGLARTLLDLADLAQQSGQVEEEKANRKRALAVLEQLAADFPEDLENGYLLAVQLWEQGRVAESARQARKLIEQQPEYDKAYNHLAWILATAADDTLRNPAEAVSLAKKAVAARPKSTLCWNTLGVALYRAGDDRAAREALETSMHLRDGGSAFDWFFLAMIEARQGDRKAARIWYDRAAQWADRHASADKELARFRAEAASALGIGP